MTTWRHPLFSLCVGVWAAMALVAAAELPGTGADTGKIVIYRDQAQRLFSPAKLKPTWWLPEDLVEHIESRAVVGNQ